MKAIICTAYGPPDVLQFREVALPVPAEDDVLIKVVAATAFTGDCEIRGFRFPLSFWIPLRLMFGVFRPRKRYRVLGQELAGTVVETGVNVTGLKPGDAVFAPLEKFGAYAEYACLDTRSNVIVIKPGNMSFEQAATVPVGGLNALHFIHKAEIAAGESVLINGAAGSIGPFAVQLAKLRGAEVTAVDSGPKLEMLQSIGADRVIDFMESDFTRQGDVYDVIIDVVGKSSYSGSLSCLRPGGRYILGNPRFGDFFRSQWTSRVTSKKVITAIAGYRKEDLEHLKTLIEAGKLKTVIDRRYRLEPVSYTHLTLPTTSP